MAVWSSTDPGFDSFSISVFTSVGTTSGQGIIRVVVATFSDILNFFYSK